MSMNIFDNYETSALEELRVNISQNFHKTIERIGGVTKVIEDYSAHYELYRVILNSVYNNWDAIKHKYQEGANYGDILLNELDEELLKRTIHKIAKKNENKP